jgi:hypothetical protein
VLAGTAASFLTPVAVATVAAVLAAVGFQPICQPVVAGRGDLVEGAGVVDAGRGVACMAWVGSLSVVIGRVVTIETSKLGDQ